MNDVERYTQVDEIDRLSTMTTDDTKNSVYRDQTHIKCVAVFFITCIPRWKHAKKRKHCMIMVHYIFH